MQYSDKMFMCDKTTIFMSSNFSAFLCAMAAYIDIHFGLVERGSRPGIGTKTKSSSLVELNNL